MITFTLAQLPFQVEPRVRGFPGKRHGLKPSASIEPMYRLNNTFIPSHYDVEVRVILDNDGSVGPQFTAPGKVKIIGVNQERTSRIVLHANALTISSDSITVALKATGQRIVVSRVSEEDERDFYIIELGSEINAGDELEIHMEHVAQIMSSDGNGLFYREYLTETGEVRRIGVTQFAAVEARRMFPCFDEETNQSGGMVVYGPTYILFFPGEDPEVQRTLVTLVVCHELAHQYFGNLVTLKWWNEVYLNEGLATYTQYLGMEAVSPDLMGVEYAIIDAVQLSMVVDASENTHPLSSNVTTPQEISAMFTDISYEKGASVMRMVEGFLTYETLRKALQSYLKRMAFQGAKQEDLFDALQEAAVSDDRLPPGLNMHDIMSSWTMQTGFPVVNVQIANETVVRLSQDRFKNNGAPELEGSWFVPITIVTQDKPNLENNIPQVWLHADGASAMVQHDLSKWIMINQNATEYVTFEAVLNLTRYFSQETHFTVWKTFFYHFTYIYTFFSSHPGYNDLRSYLQPRIEAALAAVGVEESDSHTGANAILRAELLDWACSLWSPLCFEYAAELFDQWQANPDNSPVASVDARATLECAMVASSGKKAFDFVFAKYQEAGDALLREQLLSSLSCTIELLSIHELLNKTLNSTSGIKPDDAASVLVKVSSNAVGRTVILDFLSDHFEDVINVIGSGGPQPIAQVLGTLRNYFSTQDQLDQVEAFVAAHQEVLNPINAEIDSAIKTIQGNIIWMDTTGFDIWMWFQ
ncbi:Aminopeptidase N [Orchesella cincta]|uniref:Aminopeptidase n=1 Tax=Orchesella cincta TaxID=48709 RepID=A0A1D2NJB2_ORCCI|nr:Aminopeptidase N [Orchesella cincta]